MATEAQGHVHIDTNLLGAPENSPTLKFIALGVSPEVREFTAHVVIEFAVDATTTRNPST